MIRYKLRNNQRPHYAIFKSVELSDFDGDLEELEYAQNKQSLVIDDLRRFNINPIIVSSYQEVDDIIERLYRRSVRRNVFISSASSDPLPWGEDAVTQFCHQLGSLLTKRGFRIVTGVGLGSGGAVMAGAITEIISNNHKRLDDDIILRPFPVKLAVGIDAHSLFSAYRKDMIERAGIALFLFGTRIRDGVHEPSLGMEEEFRIAQESGLLVIPVGATGGMAGRLSEDFHRWGNDFSPAAKALVDEVRKPVKDLNNLLGPIIDLLELLGERA